MSPRNEESDEDVLARRAQILRWVTLGKRAGYGLFGFAVVGFFAGFFIDFPQRLVSAIVSAIVVGSIILAPAIVFGYGVKAAERDDVEQGRSTMNQPGDTQP